MPKNHQEKPENSGQKEPGISSQRQLDRIAHDVRGALSVITGYAQMMLDQTTGEINEAQRRALEDILDRGKKLDALTDDIFQKLEAILKKGPGPEDTSSRK